MTEREYEKGRERERKEVYERESGEREYCKKSIRKKECMYYNKEKKARKKERVKMRKRSIMKRE